jgi:hypothetical protein
MGKECQNPSPSVHLVHLTPTEPVVDALGRQPHATVHDIHEPPRKCEDYCEREVDDFLAS